MLDPSKVFYLKEVKPALCTARYLQCHVNLATGQTASCHHTPWHKIENYADLHNTFRKSQVRDDAKLGIKNKDCSYCWSIESTGGVSDRYLKSTAEWAKPSSLEQVHLQYSDLSVLPTYLEVAVSNVCNMQCMYCDPRASSKWLADYKTNGSYSLPGTEFGMNPMNWLAATNSMPLPYSEDKNPWVKAFEQWFPTVLPNLHTLRFTGGEPTLSKVAMESIEKAAVDCPPNLRVVGINTNLMIEDATIEKFKDWSERFAAKGIQFQIFASIDAWGKDAEMVRGGLDFGTFWRNFQALSSEISKSANVVAMVSVNRYSVSTLHVLLKAILEERAAGGVASFSLSRIRYPEFLDITHLTKESAVALRSRLLEIQHLLLDEESYQLEALIKELESITTSDRTSLMKEQSLAFQKQYKKRVLRSKACG